MVQIAHEHLYSWAFQLEARHVLFIHHQESFRLGDGFRRDHIVSEELQSLEVFSCDSTLNRFSWEFLFFCLCFQHFFFCYCQWSSHRMIFLPPLLSEPLIIAIHLCYNLISLWVAVKKELLNPNRLCWCVCPFLYPRIKWITSERHSWETWFNLYLFSWHLEFFLLSQASSPEDYSLSSRPMALWIIIVWSVWYFCLLFWDTGYIILVDCWSGTLYVD